MKVPPRTLFWGQAIASLWSCVVQVAVLYWAFGNIDGKLPCSSCHLQDVLGSHVPDLKFDAGSGTLLSEQRDLSIDLS